MSTVAFINTCNVLDVLLCDRKHHDRTQSIISGAVVVASITALSRGSSVQQAYSLKKPVDSVILGGCAAWRQDVSNSGADTVNHQL